jgi:Fe-S cluster biogenesis protein NfuA
VSFAEQDSLRQRVARVVAEEVDPLLQMDVDQIEVLEVSKGVARIRFHGPCTGCPATIMALIMSLEEELRWRIPEVEYLEAVP